MLVIKEVVIGCYVYVNVCMVVFLGCVVEGLIDEDWLEFEVCVVLCVVDQLVMV